ncbi:hypothetical protein [Zobellia laminariae]|uniref:hypothetical protein n=1 Tax=Zobellia laminariae TaxID=248906 RepID=UPI0026F46D71|nr:hypothetical protein [Zobellia laminariae]WKX75205.1 hypothetical protein Q5W13_16000 [Zobellia laminariae]
MKKLIPLLILVLVANILQGQSEDSKIMHMIDASYDSKSELGYLFISRLDESPITFNQINLELLQKFNLNDDSLKGSTFKITYGTEKLYAEENNAQNSIPIKEKKIILNLEQIE